MVSEQQKIINRLISLACDGNISVDVTPEKTVITISHTAFHSADFKLRWLGDHYAVYFVDGNGESSQAVCSIWNPLDAIKFGAMYMMMIELRAKRVVN